MLDGTADCMSNGAWIVGTRRPDWRSSTSRAGGDVKGNGRIVVQKTGGHVAGDRILPAIALVNALRMTSGVQAGQFTPSVPAALFRHKAMRSSGVAGSGAAEVKFAA